MARYSDNITGTSGSSTGRRFYPNKTGGPLLTVDVVGTFSSGTVTIETSPDEGTTWVAASGVTAFTSSGNDNIYANSEQETPRQFRATLASGSSASDVTVYFWDYR